MKTLKQRAQEAIDSGFTVGELAKAAGKSSSAVSQWLSGDTKSIKADSAIGLQALTGWSASWWATGKGPREAAANQAGGDSRSAAPASSAESLADTLGDSLMSLDGALYQKSVDSMRKLAESPDSTRARVELMDVLQHAKPDALAGDRHRISLELLAAQLRGAYAAAIAGSPPPNPQDFVSAFIAAVRRHND